jgi:excisionase family DNA binding protein
MGRATHPHLLRTERHQDPRKVRSSSAGRDTTEATVQKRTPAHPLVSVGADSDPWLTLQQAAAIVQIHEATLRREIHCRRLRSARIGGRKSIRLRRSWLDAWLEASATPVEMAR